MASSCRNLRWLVLSCAPVVLCSRLAFAAEEDASVKQSLTAQIDLRIDERLKTEWKLSPAERCSDAEFIRRVYLDLTGATPDISSVRQFLADTSAQKREALIDRLLSGDLYARHMATVFDVMLMERRPDKYVTADEWRPWLARSFAENKPLNVLVAEILGADGVDNEQRPAAKFYLDRAVEKDTLVKDIGRLFLGMNLQCAQCHNHPDIDSYLHQHYHGLAAFVAGSKTFRQKDGTFVLQEVALREVEFASVFEPDATQKTGPRLLDAIMDVPEFPEGEEYVEKPSRTVRSVPKFSLRKLLSERLPSKETPEFSRNMANRLWAMMMGRGLVHPLDMHHAGNPASHPELLQNLADHFAATDFDVRELLRGIALSHAYQRTSFIPADVDPDDVPVESYAVANLKGLSPEQLFESLLVGTQSAAVLEKQIDEALAEEDATSESSEKSEEEVTEDQIAAARRQKRQERIAEFVSVFGSVPGQAEEGFAASLPQALFLANSETVANWIPARDGNLAEQLVGVSNTDAAAEELFLSILSRYPTDDERELVKDTIKDAGSAKPQKIAALIWSLIASAEFRLNH